MVFECGTDGADKAVCIHLATMINPGIRIVPRTLDDKPNLISDAGKTAEELFELNCERVLIIWDLRPAWPNLNSKPCLVKERNAILNTLTAASLSCDAVDLICILHELEAWLLSDERAIRDVLSTKAHPITIRRRRNVDRLKNPKGILNSLFKRHRGRRYVDRYHAKEIAMAIPDLQRLRRIDSFRRFERAILPT